MKTKEEKIIEGLLERECKEIPCKSRKYRQFLRQGLKDATGQEMESFYFVGRNGALRVGKNISNSFSISRISGRFIK